MGSVASQHAGSSWIRDWTDVPWIARQIFNHWTTREALVVTLFQVLLLQEVTTKNRQSKTQEGKKNRTGSRYKRRKQKTYNINILKWIQDWTRRLSMFVCIAHNHFVIRNKSFRSGGDGGCGASKVIPLCSQLGFWGCAGRRSPPLPFLTHLGPVNPMRSNALEPSSCFSKIST